VKSFPTFALARRPCFLSNILLLCFHGLATASFHFAVLSSEGMNMFQGVCLCGLNRKRDNLAVFVRQNLAERGDKKFEVTPSTDQTHLKRNVDFFTSFLLQSSF
jgi:hypothetical protein